MVPYAMGFVILFIILKIFPLKFCSSSFWLCSFRRIKIYASFRQLLVDKVCVIATVGICLLYLQTQVFLNIINPFDIRLAVRHIAGCSCHINYDSVFRVYGFMRQAVHPLRFPFPLVKS